MGRKATSNKSAPSKAVPSRTVAKKRKSSEDEHETGTSPESASPSKRSHKAASSKGKIEEVMEAPFSSQKCTAWFKKFACQMSTGSKNKKEYVMNPDGQSKFCESIGIAYDIPAVVLLRKWGIRKMTDTLPQAKFVDAMRELGCDSEDQLKRKVPDLVAPYKTRAALLDLCKFLFDYITNGGEKTDNRRTNKEAGSSLFLIMLKSTWPMYDEFSEYYEKSDVRGLSLDTFQGICDLASRYPTRESLKTYDTTTAWPSLADEFVENVLDKQKRSALSDENEGNSGV